MDTLVTVVDAFNFYKDFGGSEIVYSQKLNNDPDEQRSIVNLLVNQIEYAKVIILNKADLVSIEQVAEINTILAKLNPAARVLVTQNSEVDLNEIINTKLFDFENASLSAGWQEELRKVHSSETEEYGIGSFVFRNKKPFHPERLWEYLSFDWPSSIDAAKDCFIWLPERMKLFPGPMQVAL